MKLSSVFTFTSLTFLVSSLSAQLPRTTIDSLYPPAGQRGSEINIAIKGKETKDATWLKFTHEAIKAKQVMSDAGEPKSGEFTVSIGKDVPAGLYEVQIGGGRFGASNIATFLVGTLPHHLVTSGNQSMEKAMPIETGNAYIGKSVARNYSYFSFEAKKGEPLFINCLAGDFDSGMKPVLKVLNSSGRELVGEPQKGYLEFTAKEDATYTLQLFDFLYAGSDSHYYKLSISKRPQIDLIEPPVGKPGSQTEFTIFGRNLPNGQDSDLKLPSGQKLQQLKVKIHLPANPAEKDVSQLSTKLTPKQILLPVHTWQLESPQGHSNPVFIGLSNDPIVQETNQPNDLAEQAQEIKVPCEFVGKFFPFADKDYLQFKAAKGDNYFIEAISERLGRPSNLFMLIQQVTKNDKGEEQVKNLHEALETTKNIGGIAFPTATTDPIQNFTAPVDGTFRILVYDLFDNGLSDIRNQYRISIRKAQPDYTLAAYIKSHPSADGKSSPVRVWPASLRKNEITTLHVIAYRKDNFDAPIELEIKGLPPTITYSPKTIPPKAESLTVLLKASPDAKPWSGELQITGKAKVEGKDITRNCHPAAVTYASYDSRAKATVVDTRMIRKLTLAINEKEASPVTIEPQGKVFETSLHGIVKIPFKFSQTDEGFKQTRKVKINGHTLLAKIKEVNVDTKKDEGEIALNLTQAKFPVGEYPLYLSSLIKGKYKLYTDEQKKEMDQKVKDADKASKDAAGASKKADADYNAVKSKKDVPNEEKEKKKVASEDAKKKATMLANRLKALQEESKLVTEGVKPKDINEYFYSPSILLRVTPSPVKFKKLEAVKLEQESKFEWKPAIERLYEYADAVTLSLTIPKEAKGVTVKNGSIAKGKDEGSLQFTCAKTAVPGKYTAKLKATLKVNNQTITMNEDVPLEVNEKPAEPAETAAAGG